MKAFSKNFSFFKYLIQSLLRRKICNTEKKKQIQTFRNERFSDTEIWSFQYFNL